MPSRPTLPRWSTRRCERTAGNRRMTLAIALNYGARAELVQAARGIAGGRSGRARSGEIDEATIEARARHRRSAAARPADPHLGRAAPVQLPALAGGLCRIAVRRHALARFRRRRPARRAGRICRPRAPLRRPMSEAPTPAPQSDLPTRFAAGVVMIAVACAATYVGGWPFRLLVAAGAAVMLVEWARHAPGASAAMGLGRRSACSPRAARRRRISLPGRRDRRDREVEAVDVRPSSELAGLRGRRLAALLARPGQPAPAMLGWGILYVGIPPSPCWASPGSGRLPRLLGVPRHLGDRHLRLFRRPLDRRAEARAADQPQQDLGRPGRRRGRRRRGRLAGRLVCSRFRRASIPLARARRWGSSPRLGDLYESWVKRRPGSRTAAPSCPAMAACSTGSTACLPSSLATLLVLMAGFWPRDRSRAASPSSARPARSAARRST